MLGLLPGGEAARAPPAARSPPRALAAPIWAIAGLPTCPKAQTEARRPLADLTARRPALARAPPAPQSHALARSALAPPRPERTGPRARRASVARNLHAPMRHCDRTPRRSRRGRGGGACRRSRARRRCHCPSPAPRSRTRPGPFSRRHWGSRRAHPSCRRRRHRPMRPGTSTRRRRGDLAHNAADSHSPSPPLTMHATLELVGGAAAS